MSETSISMSVSLEKAVGRAIGEQITEAMEDCMGSRDMKIEIELSEHNNVVDIEMEIKDV